MTAGSGFVPVVDDYLVNRLAAVPRPRDGHRVRAVTNRLQALKAIELPSFRGRVGYAASDQPQRLTLSPPHPQLLLFLQRLPAAAGSCRGLPGQHRGERSAPDPGPFLVGEVLPGRMVTSYAGTAA